MDLKPSQISGAKPGSLPDSWEASGIYPIVDLGRFEDDSNYVGNLIRNGIRIIQFRAKNCTAEKFKELTIRLIDSHPALGRETLLIVNDSPEICLAVGAGGVHLGQDDQDPHAARAMLGPAAVIGYSTHNLEQVKRAQELPVNYLGFGPVFASPTKQGHAPETGVDILAEAVSISQLPIVAIGGVTADNVSKVYQAGAAAAAVISDLRSAEDLGSRLQLYQSANKSRID